MDKINWKSFSPPAYKSDEGVPKAPEVDEGMLGDGKTGQDLQTTVEDIFNGGPQADQSDIGHPFSLTINQPSEIGTTIDPITGEKIQDPEKTPYYIPSVEEFLYDAKTAKLGIKLSDYDKLVGLYTKAKGDLTAEMAKKLDELENDSLGSVESNTLRQVIGFIDASIKKANDALGKIPTLKKEAEADYLKEYSGFKTAAGPHYKEFNEGTPAQRSDIIKSYLNIADINTDGWIGEPEKGIRIESDVKFKDGTKGWAIFDSDTGKSVTRLATDGTPVTSKWIDPGSEWQLSKSGLELTGEKGENGETVLRVSGNGSIETGNEFDAKIDLAVSDVITVLADENGREMLQDTAGSPLKAIPAEFTADGTKIMQKKVTDYKNYVQKMVLKVIIKSIGGDGRKLKDGYDQRVTFEGEGGLVLAEFIIKGKNSGDYASNYGFALDGSQRKEAVSIYAEEMFSTYKHNMGAQEKILLDEYNVDPKKLNKSESGADPTTAFEATMVKFKGGSCKVAADSSDATGLMVKGLSGYITGSSHGNNLVFFSDPSKVYSKDSREGKEEDTNPLFANVFTSKGNSNYNAVFSNGGGDFYADNVTLAWRDTTSVTDNSDLISAVSVKNSLGVRPKSGVNGTPNTNQDLEPIQVDAFVFMGGGGIKSIDNQPDSYTEGSVQKQRNGDDYFNSGETATYTVPKDKPMTADIDADSIFGVKDGNPAVGHNDVIKAGDDIESALKDLDKDELEPDEDLNIKDLGGDFYSETYQSLNATFEELSAGLNISNNSWLDEPPDGGLDPKGNKKETE